MLVLRGLMFLPLLYPLYLDREYFYYLSVRLKGNGYRRGKKINPHIMGYVMGVMQSPWL